MNAKACKIILIIIYVISTLYNFFRVFLMDGLLEGDKQLKAFLTAILDTLLYGFLFLGAGIFDLD